MDWSKEGQQKLQELRIDPQRVTPLDLRAIVKWLQDGLNGEPGRPVLAIYGVGRGIPNEDGALVRRSKGWVYGKILNRVGNKELEWIFDKSAVGNTPNQGPENSRRAIDSGNQQAFLNHWEDLRVIAKEIAQQLSIKMDSFGWVIKVPEPREAVARRLWEDLQLHTADHDTWTLLKEFQELKDSATKFQTTAKTEAAQLGREKTWSEKTLRDSLQRALFDPKPRKLGPANDSEGIDFNHIWQSNANAVRELQSVKKLGSILGRLNELKPNILDSIASLQVRRQFTGDCPDCPGRAAGVSEN